MIVTSVEIKKETEYGISEGSKYRLETLLESLTNKGFVFEVRPGGQKDQLLVFLKLSGPALQKYAREDISKSFQAGSTGANTSELDRLRITYETLTKSKSQGGLGITPAEGDFTEVVSITPLNEYVQGTSFGEAFKTTLKKGYSVEKVKDAFGVQAALYFEGLRLFIVWLVGLAGFGVAAHFKTGGTARFVYSTINLIWGVTFLVAWQYKLKVLTNKWGVQNSPLIDKLDRTSLESKGAIKSSETHKSLLARDYSTFLKQLAFIPIALGFFFALLTYQLGCFVVEIFLTEIYDGPGKQFLSLVPTILISGFVPVISIVYGIVCNKVLAWENHAAPRSRENSLIIKNLFLLFLVNYAPLFITTFLYLPFCHAIAPQIVNFQGHFLRKSSQRGYYKFLATLKKRLDLRVNRGRLQTQYFYFIVTNLIVQLGMKYVLPPVMGIVLGSVFGGSKKIPSHVDNPLEEGWLSAVRAVVSLPSYDANDDICGFAVKFGFLIIFGPVWSIAPLATLFFTVLTFWLDLFKLKSGKYFKPSIPSRADSIYPWNYVFLGLVVIGTVLSPYRHLKEVTEYSGELSYDMAGDVKYSGFDYLLATLLEHSVLALYFALSTLASKHKSKEELGNVLTEQALREKFGTRLKEISSFTADITTTGWPRQTPEQVIESAEKRIQFVNQKALEDTQKSSTPGGEKSLLKGHERLTLGDSVEEKQRIIREKEQLLKQKEDLLRKEALENDKKSLEQSKDQGDEVIETRNEKGDLQASTIDNNNHFDLIDANKVAEKAAESKEKSTTSQQGIAQAGAAEPSATKSGDSKPENSKTGASKPEASKPEETKPVAFQSEDTHPESIKAKGEEILEKNSNVAKEGKEKVEPSVKDAEKKLGGEDSDLKEGEQKAKEAKDGAIKLNAPPRQSGESSASKNTKNSSQSPLKKLFKKAKK